MDYGGYRQNIRPFYFNDNINYYRHTLSSEGVAYGINIDLTDLSYVSRIDMTNDYFAVGITNENRVVVYNNDGTNWQIQQEIKKDSDILAQGFGQSIKFNGTQLFIGDPLYDGKGAVFLYELIIIRGHINHNYTNDIQNNDRFGHSIASYGDKLAISSIFADNDQTGINQSGVVYIYDEQNNDWVFENKIIPQVSSSNDAFGHKLEMSNKYLVVGSYLMDYGNTSVDGGKVHVYHYREAQSSWDWTNPNIIIPTQENPFKYFGHSISLHDNSLAIGAINGIAPNNVKTGLVFLYEYEAATDTWVQATNIYNPLQITNVKMLYIQLILLHKMIILV